MSFHENNSLLARLWRLLSDLSDLITPLPRSPVREQTPWPDTRPLAERDVVKPPELEPLRVPELDPLSIWSPEDQNGTHFGRGLFPQEHDSFTNPGGVFGIDTYDLNANGIRDHDE